jgi:hypothetical protein
LGAHSAWRDLDGTGPIPSEVLVKAAMEDSGTIHPDHFPPDEVAQAKTWGSDVLDRALRTALQSALAWFSTAQASGHVFDRKEIVALFGVVASSVLLSLLTALVSAPGFDNSWWFQVLERGVKTLAQSILAGWGVSEAVDVASTTGFPVNFTTIVTSAGVAALTSVMMSVVTTNMGNTDNVGIGNPV